MLLVFFKGLEILAVQKKHLYMEYKKSNFCFAYFKFREIRDACKHLILE